MAVSIINLAAIAANDAILAFMNNGTTNPQGQFVIYGGTPPADAETALTGQPVLSEHDATNPAFPGSTDGNPGATTTANPVADDNSANATGLATFFRALDRDGNVVYQGSVGGIGSGEDMEINNPNIQIGVKVQVVSVVFRHAES